MKDNNDDKNLTVQHPETILQMSVKSVNGAKS